MSAVAEYGGITSRLNRSAFCKAYMPVLFAWLPRTGALVMSSPSLPLLAAAWVPKVVVEAVGLTFGMIQAPAPVVFTTARFDCCHSTRGRKRASALLIETLRYCSRFTIFGLAAGPVSSKRVRLKRLVLVVSAVL